MAELSVRITTFEDFNILLSRTETESTEKWDEAQRAPRTSPARTERGARRLQHRDSRSSWRAELGRARGGLSGDWWAPDKCKQTLREPELNKQPCHRYHQKQQEQQCCMVTPNNVNFVHRKPNRPRKEMGRPRSTERQAQSEPVLLVPGRLSRSPTWLQST